MTPDTWYPGKPKRYNGMHFDNLPWEIVDGNNIAVDWFESEYWATIALEDYPDDHRIRNATPIEKR